MATIAPEPRAVLNANNTLPKCAIQGNSDLYGLGIRISVYIQYLTILVAAISGRKFYSKIRTAVLIYAVAILIVVFRNSIAGSIYGLEVQIIQLLVLVQLSTVLPTSWVYSVVGWFIYLAITANSAYFVWYWFRGLDYLPKSACADEYAWIFAKVSLYHGYRTYNKVLACVFLASSLLQPFSGSFSLTGEGGDAEAFQGGNIFILLPIIPFVIAACEMTIKWNGITGVNSIAGTGQLIPLVLSIGQFLYFLYEGIRGLENDENGNSV